LREFTISNLKLKKIQIIFFSVLLVMSIYPHIIELIKFYRCSSIASGIVVSTRKVEAHRSYAVYTKYEFATGGYSYTGSEKIYETIFLPYKKFLVGDSLTVHYNPIKPSESIIYINKDDLPAVIFIISFLVITISQFRKLKESENA